MFYPKGLLSQLEEVHSQFTIVHNPPFSEISLFYLKFLILNCRLLVLFKSGLFTTENWKKLTGFIVFFKKKISFTEKGLKGIVVNRACTSLNRKSFENAVTVPLKSGFVLKYIVRPNQTVFAKSVP